MSAGEAIVREWALHLFQMTLQGSLVAALLLPVAAAARRTSPGFRSALLSVVLAKFLLPPMLPLPTGVFSRFDAAPQEFFSRVGVGACAAIAAVHVAGFGISLVRLAALRRRHRGWVRGSIPFDRPGAPADRRRGPETRVSTAVSVPCAIGGGRPAVLLPAGLADAIGSAELEAVIFHEREHLRRRDPARATFEAFVTAFWWFHPAVRALVARRRATREERCDDAVLRRFPGAVYGRALLAAAAFGGPGPGAVVAATGPAGDLSRRLRRIADPGRSTRPRRIAAALAVAAAAALLVPGVRPAAGPAFSIERASR